jgi:hypothetical protein
MRLILSIEDRPLGLRAGQWAFNVLRERHPEVADQVHGTESDPFYADALLPAFWEYLVGLVSDEWKVVADALAADLLTAIDFATDGYDFPKTGWDSLIAYEAARPEGEAA